MTGTFFLPGTRTRKSERSVQRASSAALKASLKAPVNIVTAVVSPAVWRNSLPKSFGRKKRADAALDGLEVRTTAGSVDTVSVREDTVSSMNSVSSTDTDSSRCSSRCSETSSQVPEASSHVPVVGLPPRLNRRPLDEPLGFGFATLTLERPSQLPLPRLVIRSVKAPIDDAGLVSLLAAMNELLACGEPFTVLFDVRQCTLPSREQIKIGKKWNKANGDALDALLQGIVVLVASSAVRVLANSLLSVSKPPQPARIVSNEASALNFAREHCAHVRQWQRKSRKHKKRAAAGPSHAAPACSDRVHGVYGNANSTNSAPFASTDPSATLTSTAIAAATDATESAASAASAANLSDTLSTATIDAAASAYACGRPSPTPPVPLSEASAPLGVRQVAAERRSHDAHLEPWAARPPVILARSQPTGPRARDERATSLASQRVLLQTSYPSTSELASQRFLTPGAASDPPRPHLAAWMKMDAQLREQSVKQDIARKLAQAESAYECDIKRQRNSSWLRYWHVEPASQHTRSEPACTR